MKFFILMWARTSIRKLTITGAGFACWLILLLLTRQTQAADKPLSTDAPGSIAGVVQDTQGAPLANIQVNAYQKSVNGNPQEWFIARTATTDPTGAYKLPLLAANVYHLEFLDPNHNYISAFYTAATSIISGTDLPVAGNNLTGINAQLRLGGRITGTVALVGNRPWLRASVWANHKVGDIWQPVYGYDQTLTNGKQEFQIGGLETDVYRVCAQVTVTPTTPTEPTDLAECYNDIASGVQHATDVPLKAGQTVSNVNLLLGDSADLVQITGMVTSLTNQPLAGIRVTAAVTPTFFYQPLNLSYSTKTNASGVYQLSALLPATYTLDFADEANTYAAEYYDDAPTLVEAKSIHLPPRTQLANVNASLAPGSQITGVITMQGESPRYAYLKFYRKGAAGWQPAFANALEWPSNRYTARGLPAGIYRVFVSTSLDGKDDYIGYYGGKTLESATDVTLGVGETKTNINIDVAGPQLNGAISGLVTGEGLPLANVKVALYRSSYSFSSPLVYTYTNQAGRYLIGGLADDQYVVGFADLKNGYVPIYYPQQPYTPINVRVLSVQNGNAITNVNVALIRAGAIRGHVRLPDGAPLPGVQVFTTLHQPNWSWRFNAVTDASGAYTLTGLAAGAYQVRFLHPLYTHGAEVYYAGPGLLSTNASQALTLTLQAGLTCSDIDAVMANLFLPLIQQKAATARYFNMALVSKCERQPAGTWFDGTTSINGQPQNGHKVVFSYKADGPWATNPVISGPHEGYPGWKTGYYSHIIRAGGPIVGDWYVWIVDDTGKRISEIAHWQSTGPGEGCNQAEVDFDSR